jgi:hypothetical protein
MELNKGIKSFWQQIGIYLYSNGGIFLFLGFLCWIGWRFSSLMSLPIILGLIIGLSLLLFPLFWWLSDVKSQLLKAFPDTWEPQTALVEDYPQLNLDLLLIQTSTLESLGFVQLMDWKAEPGNGFVRCFAHPQQYCFAEIGQFFNATGESTYSNCTIFSLLEQDWIIGEINREIRSGDGFSYICRYPKEIRTYSPNLNLDELLQTHLRLREKILVDLGISLLTDVSWSAFYNFQKTFVIRFKQTLKRKNLLLAMFEATLFERNPKSQWLGDYPQEAVKKRANSR